MRSEPARQSSFRAWVRAGMSVLLLTLWVHAGAEPLRTATGPEARAFNVAAELFRARFFAQAETEFGGFIQQFPNSPRVPEAVLYQAEARVETTNYGGAIELLKAHQAAAGTNADQYLFWTAEAYFRQRDFQAASAGFDQLLRQFPASTRCLEALVGEATARSQLAQWSEVVSLLAPTNSVLQRAARASATNELAARGWLLLSEAHLFQEDYTAAEQALGPLAEFRREPRLAWQREYLRCRILLARGQTEAALQNSSNLLAFAAASGQRQLQGGSVAFQAGLLEKLGRLDAAIAAYTNNLRAELPVERQRQALLKVSQLYLAQDKVAEAARELEHFLGGHSNAPAADVALLTLGELRLRQQTQEPQTNQVSPSTESVPGLTNYLDQALSALQTFTNQFPQSPWFGKAQLNLGWCYWLSGKIAASQAAFQTAFERLPDSVDRAMACYKLADAQFQQTNFTAATASYGELFNRFAELPQVKTNLLEPALYQAVRAGLAAGDLPAATNALGRLLAGFPNGFHTGQAVLLTGQQASERDPKMARKIFSDFLLQAPQMPLGLEVEQAIARTYEQENDWVKAVEHYDRCLAGCSNLVIQPRVEYYRALANFRAGRETNALVQFTRLIGQFPRSEYVPLAQWWVADYAFRNGNLMEAEAGYQAVYQNTNFPPSELAYQARMNAGRVAVERQSWENAKDYFAWLASNTNCPTDLQAQAFAAYGDYLMSHDSTNRLDDYKQALNSFEEIIKTFKNAPTNRLVVLAWGEKAECFLQMMAHSVEDFKLATNAFQLSTNAFQQVISMPGADVTNRSAAKIGLGRALEAMAGRKDTVEANKAVLLNQALRHYLDVLFEGNFYREGEVPDAFWRKKAGLEAVRLTEELKLWEQEIRICQRMQELLPPLARKLEEKIQKANEKLR